MEETPVSVYAKVDNSKQDEREIVFPTDLLLKLECMLSRCRWVIPISPDQELPILLRTCIEFCQKGLDKDNASCQKFIKEVMPLCFNRLMNDDAVSEWKDDEQRHIMDCCVLFLELCVLKFNDPALPCFLEILAFIFNPRNKFHLHNCQKRPLNISKTFKIDEDDLEKGSEILDYNNNDHDNEIDSGAISEEEGAEETFARSISFGPPKVWLVSLINNFGKQGGFVQLCRKFEDSSSLTCSTLYVFLRPFGMCCQFLTPQTVEKYFSNLLEKSGKYMHNINDAELKKETKGSVGDSVKENSNVPVDIVKYLRNLTARMPGRENIVRDLERLRLKMILKTLQFSSFSAKMNALNEISRILSSSSHFGGSLGSSLIISANNNSLDGGDSSNQQQSPLFSPLDESDLLLTTSEILIWLRDNDFVGVAIKENLHITQYVDKLERVFRFLIKERWLTNKDLDQIWSSAQSGIKHEAIVKNVHDLLAKLAWDFNGDQLDYLFGCFQTSWHHANKRQREKLLELIRRLAEDDKEGKLADKVLELLWSLASEPDVPADVMEQALQCQAKILDVSCSCSQRERHLTKIWWLGKCIDEIRRDAESPTVVAPHAPPSSDPALDSIPYVLSFRSFVLPVMKHFRDICRQYTEQAIVNKVGWHPDGIYRHNVINRLQEEQGLVAIVAKSLVKYIERRRNFAEFLNKKSDFRLDDRYSHVDQIKKRLSFLKFLLRDGRLWLCQAEAEQIWQCLICDPVQLQDPENRHVAFKWFAKMMEGECDLDPTCWNRFFETKVLQVDPAFLNECGMLCFERFYKNVNCNVGRLVKIDSASANHGRFILSPNSFATKINNFDTLGQEYLWRVAMNADEPVANLAIQLIHDVYGSPSPQLYTQLPQFHADFIQSCLSRLKACYETLSLLIAAVDKKAFNAIANPADSNGLQQQQQIRQLLIRSARALCILYGYVRTYDEKWPDFLDFDCDENCKHEDSAQNSRSMSEKEPLLHSIRRPPPMYRAGVGRTISVKVAMSSLENQTINNNGGSEVLRKYNVHTNSTLMELRQLVARDLHVFPRKSSRNRDPLTFQNATSNTVSSQDRFYKYLSLSYRNEVYENVAYDKKTLTELGIEDGSTLQGRILGARFYRRPCNVREATSSPESSIDGDESSPGNSQDEEPVLMSAVTHVADIDSLKPGDLLTREPEVFDLLLNVADLASKLCCLDRTVMFNNRPLDSPTFDLSFDLGPPARSLFNFCRRLLTAVPCSPQFGAKISKAAQTATESPSSSTYNALHNLFFAPSPNETLYNLELTYCLLAPADQSTLISCGSSADFAVHFFKAGGLKLCLSMLSHNNFLQQTEDSTLKLTAFYWISQILKLLFGVSGWLLAYQADDRIVMSERPPTCHYLASIVCGSGQRDWLRSRICKKWAEQLQCVTLGSTELKSQLPDLSHVRRMLKIAWAASSGDFSNFWASEDKSQRFIARSNELSDEELELSRVAFEDILLSTAISPDLVEPMTKEKLLQQCILDMLFSPSELIRQTAYEHLNMFVTKAWKISGRVLPYILTLLSTALYNRVEANVDICHEFFWLFRNTLEFGRSINYTPPNIENFIRKEIQWLQAVKERCIRDQELLQDETLLEGHFVIIRELVSFLDPSQKYAVGTNNEESSFLRELLEDFLLPSSKRYVDEKKFCSSFNGTLNIPRSTTLDENLSTSLTDLPQPLTVLPRSVSVCPQTFIKCLAICSTPRSITAAYDLIVALCTNCVPNLQLVVGCLTELYYNSNDNSSNEWDYSPAVNLRNSNSFVGLKNGGATCYMNSVLQQLFTIEKLRNAVLNIDPDGVLLGASSGVCEDDADVDDAKSMPFFYSNPALNTDLATARQLDDQKQIGGEVINEKASAAERRQKYNLCILKWVQCIFAHLVGSQLQYYVPKAFWRHFRFVENEPINLREQHDAVEFFNKLVDSLDEAAKALSPQNGEICGSFFGGTFADQKICKGCPHRYTREEPFNTLSLDVRHHNNLLDSLQEYVKGDLLEFENAYYCEKCNKKVDAIKRLCIKKLPPILAIQLKRFDFDWEREVAVKFHDFFEFPREVDMGPYTVEGLAKLEGEDVNDSLCDNKESIRSEISETLYKLRGIVIHSGQANGGHYYSCILHSFPNGSQKWYKFDDGDVSECHLEDDEEMRNQCFGGDYASETYDHYYRRIQKRMNKRWWNAYILFYERSNSTPLEKHVEHADVVGDVSPRLINNLSSLELSNKSLKRMPSKLETIVRQINTKSVHDRNQYTQEYFNFVKSLCAANPNALKHASFGTCLNPTAERSLLLSVQLSARFLLTTGFRAKRSLHCDALQDWAEMFEICFRLSSQCRLWMAQEALFRVRSRFSEYLFEAPSSEVRLIFGKIIMYLAHYSHNDLAANVQCVSSRHLACPQESLSDLLIRTLIVQLRKDNTVFNQSSYPYDSRVRHLKEYLCNFYIYARFGDQEQNQLARLEFAEFLCKLSEDIGCADVKTNVQHAIGSLSSSFRSPDVQKLQQLIASLLSALKPMTPPPPVVVAADDESRLLEGKVEDCNRSDDRLLPAEPSHDDTAVAASFPSQSMTSRNSDINESEMPPDDPPPNVKLPSSSNEQSGALITVLRE